MKEDKIFLGNTPAKTRAFLAGVLRNSKYKVLVVPAVGQFSIPMTAVKVGWKAPRIVTGDVSLFSTIVGYYITGTPLDDLEITVNGEPVTDYIDALYQLKYYNLLAHSKHYYASLYVRDIMDRKETHMVRLARDLENLKALKGLKYEAVDLFTQLSDWLDDPKAVIWINPPGYKLGYKRMFDTGGMVKWKEPEYIEFLPGEHHNKFREMSTGAKALFFWYRYEAIEEMDRPHAVFSEQKGPTRWDYTLCNRPEEIRDIHIKPRNLESVTARKPVLPAGHRITEESVVTFTYTDPRDALYYRDLFVHHMGITSSKWNFLLIIDGYVAGAVGLTPLMKLRGNPFEDYIEEAWGMTAYSERHTKLNRLLMMLIKSDEFLKRYDNVLFQALGITTTCLSRYPEMKINRGIYKLTSRKLLKDKSYHLRYKGERTDQTCQEVLAEWLKKYGGS